MKMINDLLLTIDLLLNNSIKLNLSDIFFVQAKAATNDLKIIMAAIAAAAVFYPTV
jgi:hypothetical protein